MAEIQNKHAVDEYSQTYSVEKKNGPGSCWNQTLSEMQLNLDSNATFSQCGTPMLSGLGKCLPVFTSRLVAKSLFEFNLCAVHESLVFSPLISLCTQTFIVSVWSVFIHILLIANCYINLIRHLSASLSLINAPTHPTQIPKYHNLRPAASGSEFTCF